MYFYLNTKSALEAPPPPPSKFYTMINYYIISYMGLP